jgi:hypothetical protein
MTILFCGRTRKASAGRPMLEDIRQDKPRKRTWALRGKCRKRPDGAKRAGKKLALSGTLTNIEALEGLARIGATVDETAVFFEISQPTVNARFRAHPELRAAWDCGRAEAQISIRRLLFEKAKHANGAGTRAALFLARMLLWPRGGDGFIEKPAGGRASPETIAGQALDRLSPGDRQKLQDLMTKMTTPPTAADGSNLTRVGSSPLLETRFDG